MTTSRATQITRFALRGLVLATMVCLAVPSQVDTAWATGGYHKRSHSDCRVAHSYWTSSSREDLPDPTVMCIRRIVDERRSRYCGYTRYFRSKGWTTCDIPEWSVQTFDLIVGPRSCDPADGRVVGTVRMVYMYDVVEEKGVAEVTVKIDPTTDLYLKGLRLFFGDEKLPRDRYGYPTPYGRYFTKTIKDIGSDENPTQEFTIKCDVTEFDAQPICFIARALVCKPRTKGKHRH